MYLPDITLAMSLLNEPLSVMEVLQTNQDSKKYGLVLSEADALEIITSRSRSLSEHGRLELGIGVTKQIITAFCSSPYINQPDYVSTINELVEIFYHMKNVSQDKIADNELITLMQSFFNKSCRGSLDLLKNRELLLMAQLVRQADRKTTRPRKDTVRHEK